MVKLNNMWEVSRTPSRSVFYHRRLITYFFAAFIAVFLCFSLAPNKAYAADASWNNDTILYSGHQYYGPVTAKTGDSINLPANTKYFTYTPTDSNGKPGNKAFVIYFAPGLDPGTANVATHADYDLSGKTFSNPTNIVAITLNPQGQGNVAETSCSVGGIGWIVCPVTTFLASGMDWVYSVLQGFMQVQPLNVTNTTPENNLYSAWGYMRNIANIAFVIGFLIIIYSQITSFGISNYGIKKLLPRLIAAAILVNLSYYICAIFIDISNTLGASIADAFINIRKQLFHIDDSTWSSGNMLSWQSLTGAVLGGSVAALGTAIGVGSVIAASGGTFAGLIFLLLPSLLGLFLTILVVMLILGARQALIIIFVIISPLAFVAYLLPNTEKYFDKWKDALTTLLIFYPAFSVVFGGSQLAGSIIVQNATSVLMIVLGMITMVAPLVITPLILKFSGGILGKFAGMVNNPKKGLMDRTRNWSGDKAELQRYKSLSSPNRYNNAFANSARRMEYNKAQQKRRLDLYKQRFDNYSTNRRNTNSRDQMIEVDMANAKNEARLHEDRFALAMDEMRAGRTDTLMQLRGEGQISRIDNIRDKVNGKLRRDTIDSMTRRALNQSVDIELDSKITASAKSSAQIIQQQNYAKQIHETEELQLAAAGIDDINGANRAYASALAAINKTQSEARSNIKLILNSVNPTRKQLREIALGTSDVINNTSETRAAAIEMIFGSRDKGAIADAYEKIDLSFPDVSDADRSMLQIVAAEAMMSGARSPWVGGGTVSNLKQGEDFNHNSISGPYGADGVNAAVIKAINDSKIDAAQLSEMGTDYLKQVKRALIAMNPGDISGPALAELRKSLDVAIDPNKDFRDQLGDSLPIIEEIKKII
jgi:hypothetical protein